MTTLNILQIIKCNTYQNSTWETLTIVFAWSSPNNLASIGSLYAHTTTWFRNIMWNSWTYDGCVLFGRVPHIDQVIFVKLRQLIQLIPLVATSWRQRIITAVHKMAYVKHFSDTQSLVEAIWYELGTHVLWSTQTIRV